MVPEAGTRDELKDWLIENLWVVRCSQNHCTVVGVHPTLDIIYLPASHCVFCFHLFEKFKKKCDGLSLFQTRPR